MVALVRHAPAGHAPLDRLKIGYGSPWVGWGPLYIAAEKGYFEDEGLDVQIIEWKRKWTDRMNVDALAAR